MLPHAAPCKDNEESGGLILTKTVRAGRRTYFFDVRATRNDDYFLTVTENRKVNRPEGGVSYERHKIYLFKEDFAKFAKGLADVIDFVRLRKPESFACCETSESCEERVG